MCSGAWGWSGAWSGSGGPVSENRSPAAEIRAALGVLIPSAAGIVLILTVVPQMTWVIFAAGWMLFPVFGQLAGAVSALGNDTASRRQSATAHVARTDAADRETTRLLGEVESEIARLWTIARAMPISSARDRALAICAAAERVLATMATSEQSETMTRWFLDHRLHPTVALFERYARLAGRGVTNGAEILQRVEVRDLPLVEHAFDAFAERLVRGDAVDLAVASEMLELELDHEPPRT